MGRETEDRKMTCLRLAECECGILVNIVGRGTMQESPTFHDLVCNCLTVCDGRMHVDLAHCEFLDSTFLGCLIQLHKKWNQTSESRFLLVASAPKKRDLFKASFYDRLLPFSEQCPEPQGEFKEVAMECLEQKEFGRHILKCHQHLVEQGGPAMSHYQAIVDRLANEIDEK